MSVLLGMGASAGLGFIAGLATSGRRLLALLAIAA